MPAMTVERIQAPTGGINSDASPDYVGALEAPSLVNLLPGRPGKVAMRGCISHNIAGITVAADPPDAFWSFDDFALIKGNNGSGSKTWRCNVATSVKTDITATLVESLLDSRHARYGDYVYGAITDAAAPQLGKWDGGATAIVPMANAPFQWTDLQVFANRLFVLGGSVPGTTTPVKAKSLFWTDPSAAVDLSLLASWVDDNSGLTNQLVLDVDDTPVALAGCGKYMAIIGSRSINILTGSGTSNFSVRNLTKNWGCVDIKTVVEVDSGFYFLSERGLAFCDGADVISVSDGRISRELALTARGGTNTAAMFGDGYLALSASGTLYLYHIATRAWTTVFLMDNPSNTPQAVFRTNTYPIIWQNGGARRADAITQPDDVGVDNDGTSTAVIGTVWTSRFARLGSPGQMATLQRLMVEYIFSNDPFGGSANAFRVRVLDTQGTELVNQIVPSLQADPRRQRFQVECFVEADAVQLEITNASTTASSFAIAEVYDAYIEFVPAGNRPTI